MIDEDPNETRKKLADLLGFDPVPEMIVCEGCGAKVPRSPCWDCQKRDEERRDREHAERRKGIPSRFAWARLDSRDLAKRVFVQSAAKPNARADVALVARAVIDFSGCAVLFTGPAGSGKTSLAVACLRAVENPATMYVAAASLERARIEHQAGHGEAPLVHRAMRAPIVLIDDLGQDKASNVSAVEAVVLARHDAELPTWVTTGLSDRDLEERYGAGVYRRLTEQRTALVIRFATEFKLT